tara:strand:+ start:17213 stop:17518 length:306 start_codon:yes stop_codon:yes gene_type:complete
MSDISYEISEAGWDDRAMYSLRQVRATKDYGDLVKLVARASIYYPKDPDYGWLLEFTSGGDRFNLGMITERFYYDGSLVSAKFAANKFISMYKKGLEDSND